MCECCDIKHLIKLATTNLHCLISTHCLEHKWSILLNVHWIWIIHPGMFWLLQALHSTRLIDHRSGWTKKEKQDWIIKNVDRFRVQSWLRWWFTQVVYLPLLHLDRLANNPEISFWTFCCCCCLFFLPRSSCVKIILVLECVRAFRYINLHFANLFLWFWSSTTQHHRHHHHSSKPVSDLRSTATLLAVVAIQTTTSSSTMAASVRTPLQTVHESVQSEQVCYGQCGGRWWWCWESARDTGRV